MHLETEQMAAELSAARDEVLAAVSTILETAERIDDLAQQLDQAAGETLSVAVAGIFEACAFQDITGQRLAKVANALKLLERRPPADAACRGGTAPEGEDGLLNGPQLPGDELGQNAVDDLFDKIS